MGVTHVTKTKTLNSVQACSALHVAHAGVRRVTVVIVHIGHEEVVVVIYFCVAILFVIFCYQEMCSLQFGDVFDCVDFAHLFKSCRKLQWSPFEHCPLAFHCQQSPRILCTRCFVP